MKCGVIIKKTRINSLFILQKRAIRICLNTDYKCHTKPLFYQLRSLNVFDTIDSNNLAFMYKAFHNLLPTSLLSYFKKVNDSHNHNTRNNTLSFKVRYRRTYKKALSICVKGTKMWNALSSDIKLSKNVESFTFRELQVLKFKAVFMLNLFFIEQFMICLMLL